MPDNPRHAPAHEFDLSGHTVLAITGRDAMAFAQAQFMNDVAALVDGQWQWNGWLTPKGRVVALFALLRRDADTLWLMLPDVATEDLARELQRFVFRSKVVLSPVDACVSGCFTAPVVAQGADFAAFDQGDIELDMGGDGGPRSLRIGTTPAPEDADALARWNAADLAHGLPRLPAAQAAQWTPQQLSLERLHAYSVKKGCYPGQEIVARTHFLGQAKRGLALFDADAPVSASDEVRVGERSIGTIVSVSATTTLAVLPLDREATTLHANGITLHERSLLGGLTR
jgi:folate-binding protein YgfZ